MYVFPITLIPEVQVIKLYLRKFFTRLNASLPLQRELPESPPAPDTFPHPLLCAGRTGPLPWQVSSGPSLLLPLFPCLMLAPRPTGWWQTDCPCK